MLLNKDNIIKEIKENFMEIYKFKMVTSIDFINEKLSQILELNLLNGKILKDIITVDDEI